jgi:L-lactate utilization protein LutC
MEGARVTAKEEILGRIRANLGPRNPTPLPEPRIRIPEISRDRRAELLLARAGALAARTFHAPSRDAALRYVMDAIADKDAVASNAPFLAECGITSLPNVRTAAYGITSADYALADTGTLVMLSSPEEARLISLLPPAHIALIPQERILSSLDELLAILPLPAEQTSSMVFITGPSRTGDIEQILVRGVHGPGEIHLVVV